MKIIKKLNKKEKNKTKNDTINNNVKNKKLVRDNINKKEIHITEDILHTNDDIIINNKIKQTLIDFYDDIYENFLSESLNDIDELNNTSSEDELYINKKFSKYSINDNLNNQNNPFIGENHKVGIDHKNPINKEFINEIEKNKIDKIYNQKKMI